MQASLQEPRCASPSRNPINSRCHPLFDAKSLCMRVNQGVLRSRLETSVAFGCYHALDVAIRSLLPNDRHAKPPRLSYGLLSATWLPSQTHMFRFRLSRKPSSQLGRSQLVFTDDGERQKHHDLPHAEHTGLSREGRLGTWTLSWKIQEDASQGSCRSRQGRWKAARNHAVSCQSHHRRTVWVRGCFL